MKAREIAKGIEEMFEACDFIQNYEACGDCPIYGVCLNDTPFNEVADYMYEGVIKDFIDYAYNGEAEAYRYEHMTEEERRWEYDAEQANLERSSLDD